MARTWKCRKCSTVNARIKQRCRCGQKRPPARQPKHLAILATPRTEWESTFGTTCNICGSEPKTRALHRDHDHATGAARGVLCFRCNSALKGWMTEEWLRCAANYLRRANG